MPPKGKKKQQTPTPPPSPNTPTKPTKTKPTKQSPRGKGKAPKANPTPVSKPAAAKPKTRTPAKRKSPRADSGRGNNLQKRIDTANEPQDQGDDNEEDEDEEDESEGDDQEVDQDEEDNNENSRAPKRRRRQEPAPTPQTVVVHVNKHDEPKFSNDAAGDVLQLGQYLFDIFGEYENSKERIVKAFEGASKNVFSSSLKTQDTYSNFVKGVLQERASTTNNFLRQYMRQMASPQVHNIQYESAVDSLWTKVNKIVKTYEWLAELCEVGMNPANDIKIEMLFASIPRHIEEQARLVSIRSNDPEVVKNSIKAALNAANNKEARSNTRRWTPNNSGQQYTDEVAAMFDHRSHADNMHHNAAAMPQPWNSTNNYGRPHDPRGTKCFACGQDGHQAKQCPNKFPMQNQTYQGRQQGQTNTACFACGQQGHQSRYCPNKRVQQNLAQQGRQQGGAYASPTQQRPHPNTQQHTAAAPPYNAMPPPQAIIPPPQQTPFGQAGGPMGPPPPVPMHPTTMQPVPFNAGNQQVSQQQPPPQPQDPRANESRPPRPCPRPGCNNDPHHLRDCPNYKGCEHCGNRRHLGHKCPNFAFPNFAHLNSQGTR